MLPNLAATVSSVARVLRDPGPSVDLAGIGADGLNLNVSFWIADPENGRAAVHSEVNLRVLRALEEAGVEIPFPQRVLRHVHGTDAAPGLAAGSLGNG